MRVCTLCGARWRGAPDTCPLDGAELAELPDELVGRTIAGRYRIVERVGEGGMGIVYRARHEVLDRDVAVKFLAPELASDTTNRQRFLREARVANRIDHEHIVDLIDFGETGDGLVFLVMEYLEGQNLGEVIAGSALEPERAVKIARQLAGALARAHELDVVHRDIKPQNVVLVSSGRGDFAKLLDFGLARMQGELRLTASGAVFGTPEYMAPEQARGDKLSGQADLYALGCVLFEMLTGSPPFTGVAPDVIMKHLREPPPALSEVRPGLPEGLEVLVARLLAKEPGARHRDGYHLVEDLDAVLDELPSAEQIPTLLDDRLAVAFQAALRRQEANADPGAPPDPPGERWRRRVERLRGLLSEVHPDGPPETLQEVLARLTATVEDLARKTDEKGARASAATRQQEDMRQTRLRLGRAIDVLGQDESRVERELDALARRLSAAWNRVRSVEATLREGWAVAPSAPDADLPIDEGEVEALVRLGQRAEAWSEAKAALVTVTVEARDQEQAREDLRFQIAQLKGRLGSLNEEGELERSRLSRETREIDQVVQDLMDRAADLAGQITDHLSGFESVRPALESA